MPMAAPRLQGCGCVTRAGLLCVHQQKRKAERDAQRPSSSARGYTSKWSRESKLWLAQPGREHCSCGCGRNANMVDHIVAPKGNMKLFWDRANWQPMFSGCNSRKNIREEGGYGRPPRGGVENFPVGRGNRRRRTAHDGDESSFSVGAVK